MKMTTPNLFKQVLSVSVVAGFLLLAYGSGDDKKAQTTDTNTTASTTTATPAAAPATPASNWTYEEDTDKMTSKVDYFAYTENTNDFNLKAPYEGAKCTLMIMNKKGKNSVMFKVSTGQIMAASELEGGKITVRFDSDEAGTYSTSSASDGSSEVVFLHPEAKFVERLKTAKKVLIQTEFYDNGTKVLEFNTSDFKWAH
jgi:hypothetical protein